MQVELNIVRARPEDAALLAEVGRMSYRQAYAEASANEELDAYLARTFDEHGLQEALKSSNTEFYIAYHEGEPVGYVKLVLNRPPPASDLIYAAELEKIYLLTQSVGLGLGASLMTFCSEVLKLQGQVALWLGVPAHNLAAQAFYKRLGFEPQGELAMPSNGSKGPQLLFIKELVPPASITVT